ncbi:SH3 domain-containing protein [Sedimentitalea nanhaiensis]|uniref:SH3 domain-containing protein n=1 Tax=Sedimentitalea nanhaiensis TaxID=999627 RepID=A0A1I7BLM4_9RHOB|nr:SH3 domain-containing protein [Sedimentitalea nanhaiensis]SFT88062.1 SH3 domain-containing protein [Sedimentitalea nanhaiensis]
MRFVFSSFAILGLVFYELSGGRDFQPPEPPAIDAAPQASAAAIPKPVVRRAAPQQVARTATTSTKTLVATQAVATVSPRDTTASRPQDGSADLSRVRSSLSQGLTLLPDSNPPSGLTLATLELGASGLGSTADAEPAARTAVLEPAPTDLREVTGTRVNMRDGPGTIYPVVARLNIGHQVEVLSTSGTGWLRLRTLPEGQLGWISSSLVSKRNR